MENVKGKMGTAFWDVANFHLPSTICHDSLVRIYAFDRHAAGADASVSAVAVSRSRLRCVLGDDRQRSAESAAQRGADSVRAGGEGIAMLCGSLRRIPRRAHCRLVC